MVRDVLQQDPAKVPFFDGDDLRQALSPDRANKALGKRIQIRTASGQSDNLDAFIAEHPANTLGEDRISIEDEVLDAEEEAIERVDQTSDDVLHPRLVGLGPDTGDLDPTGLEVDGEEDVAPAEPSQRQQLDGEEVGSTDGAPLGFEEGGPLLGATGGGVDAMLREDSGDGGAADVVAKSSEATADSGVAPGGIVDGEPDDEYRDGLCGRGSTGSPSPCAVVLAGDKAAVPLTEGLGGDDGCDLEQGATAEGSRSDGKTPPLGVGEAEAPLAELFLEDAVLLAEVGKLSVLVAAEPSGHGDDEEVKERVAHGAAPYRRRWASGPSQNAEEGPSCSPSDAANAGISRWFSAAGFWDSTGCAFATRLGR